MNQSKQVATQSPKQVVATLLQSNKHAITQVLPKHVSPERLMQVAFTAVRTTPKLLECHAPSLIGAIVQCATLGLEPNTVLGHAYLVPFRNKQQNRTDVQLVVGYKGLIDLARRSGQVTGIAAHVVREGDFFEYEYGLTPKLRHVPADGERGKVTHAYAVAHIKDGDPAFEVMPRVDIDRAMLRSQSRGEWGPWKDDYDEMARKTPIRRLSKFLPMSIEFATAVAMDAVATAGESQHLEDVLSGEYDVQVIPEREPGSEVEEGTEATAALKERLRKGDDRPIADPPRSGSGAPVDSDGIEFDPELHLTDKETDEPVYNKDGSFRKRPRPKADAIEHGDSDDPGQDLPL